MSSSQNRWTSVLLLVACLLSAGNAALYWSLSSRFGEVEGALSGLTARAQPQASEGVGQGGSGNGAHGSMRSGQVAGFIASQSPDLQVRQLKQDKAEFNPAEAAAKLDLLMAQEPALPALEQTQVRLLQQAMQNLPADAPRPAGLQTTCKGRRCLISAGFSDDLQAGDWANQLLLAGGKNLPRSARIVAVPLEGGNGAVSLQLYLY
ncbi:hypothetical protein [Thermomonas sp.]|uniref:hypothetical protein n=1 Tax=Thermomonas sp. TaxID=1971895 RepID=UPI0035B09ED0